ncbi:MAG: hypothetical protein BZY87_09535 [SAR202 cluster bacterium Io17-Chloro-G6]|nr:MAG: hypothetical protein BZY87_09535 [SAR202 cluster bacterium Io17-Chloro-G6]
MILWIDAQLSPQIASWITEFCGVEAHPISESGMLHAKDREIYTAAQEAGTVIMTKDSDFPQLLERIGPPPQVIWITCGNTSNARLRRILQTTLPTALKLLEQGEPLVEISNAQ